MAVFNNDPHEIMMKAFRNICDKVIESISWDELDDHVAETCFCDDGSIHIVVDYNLTVADSVEALAHELAHVIAGLDHGHDDAWEDAFSVIHEEYYKHFDSLTE